MRLAKAQTLIEMLVAMAVIAVGLMAAITLVYSNMNLVERDVDEVVAVNLAREGVEMAKAQRDSNWLAGALFDTGLVSATDQTATPVWDGVMNRFYFDFTANDFTHADVSVVQSPNASSPYLYANFNTAAAISGTSTLFQRMMTFAPICDDFSVMADGVSCATPKYKIGIRALSEIRWIRKDIPKNFKIYEDLYDWR